MKQAAGYVTEDGTFYESATMARLHEAREALLQEVNLNNDGDEFIYVIDCYLSIVKEYVHAKEAIIAEGESDTQSDTTAPASVSDIDHPDGYRAEANEGFQPFKIDGSGHLPDMGSGTRTEEVRHRSPVDGTGGRASNARRVRRMSIVAGDEDTKA